MLITPLVSHRRMAAGLALALSCGAVQALTVTFSGSGVVNGPAQTPPVFSGLLIGPADAAYTLGGETGWTIDVSFGGALTPGGGYAGTMNGRFLRGADSLLFTGTQSTPVLGEPIALVYTITGGTGAFAGWTGTGSSTVQLLGNPFGLPTPVPFIESNGALDISPVPEPAAAVLFAAGLLGLAGRRWRRAHPVMPAG